MKGKKLVICWIILISLFSADALGAKKSKIVTNLEGTGEAVAMRVFNVAGINMMFKPANSKAYMPTDIETYVPQRPIGPVDYPSDLSNFIMLYIPPQKSKSGVPLEVSRGIKSGNGIIEAEEKNNTKPTIKEMDPTIYDYYPIVPYNAFLARNLSQEYIKQGHAKNLVMVGTCIFLKQGDAYMVIKILYMRGNALNYEYYIWPTWPILANINNNVPAVAKR